MHLNNLNFKLFEGEDVLRDPKRLVNENRSDANISDRHLTNIVNQMGFLQLVSGNENLKHGFETSK